jgi:hypothetical protein
LPSQGCIIRYQRSSIAKNKPPPPTGPRFPKQRTSTVAPSIQNASTPNAKRSLLQSITSPQSVLKLTAIIIFAFGVTGLVSPATLHEHLFRHATESLTHDLQVRYFAFGIREILLALWTMRSLKLSKGGWKDLYLFTLTFIATEVGLMPYLFGSLGRKRLL